jgi:hypothetical protein
MHYVPFIEPCPHCSGYVEVLTESEKFLVLQRKNVGKDDVLLCTRCGSDVTAYEDKGGVTAADVYRLEDLARKLTALAGVTHVMVTIDRRA